MTGITAGLALPAIAGAGAGAAATTIVGGTIGTVATNTAAGAAVGAMGGALGASEGAAIGTVLAPVFAVNPILGVIVCVGIVAADEIYQKPEAFLDHPLHELSNPLSNTIDITSDYFI